MARKRDLASQEQELMVEQVYHPSGVTKNSGEYWNSNGWDWDCSRFVAQRVDGNAMDSDVPDIVRALEKRKGGDRVVGEDDGSLCLKLGSGFGGLSYSDEGVLRPSERVSGSLAVGNGIKIVGGNGNHPTCQVDSCTLDLSNAKDYHRRHKVCEAHSKATQALVGKQKQRFCQQCSRFHVLSEFDEGKRSCRRRLEGHNKRRRKQQPDDVTSRLLSVSGQENAVNTDFDLVSLLAALAHAQGNQDIIKGGTPTSVPDKEQLMKLISKINSFPPPTGVTTKLPTSDNLEKTSQTSPEHQSRSSANSSSLSTLNLLGVPSPVSVPDESAVPYERTSRSSDSEKTKSADTYQMGPRIRKQQTTLPLSCIGGERSSNSCHYTANDSNSHFHDAQVNLPLQLFCSSPEDNTSPPKMENSSKYFSSDGSNQNEDRSPSSSPGVELFPVKPPPKQVVNQDKIRQVCNATHGTVSFDLFGGSNRCVEVDFFRGSQNHPENASPGSANSPSSSTSGAQDLTGRILFKLFDKDPSNLPSTLRSEILTWLSNTPSQIESYIRPGCVVLSIYVSMPSVSWEQLEENLLEHVSWLLQRKDTNIWRDGRFLVQTGKKLVSHNNEKLRLCKSWMTPKAPELISVSPLAIVGGRETIVHLRGRNFNSGTKIHYTYMGGYITKEVSDAEVQDGACNETRLCSCEIHMAAPSGFGRYFTEVENGFKGNCFPIIIADSAICKELRQLEFEFEADSKISDAIFEKQEQSMLCPKTEVLHFLNELGWLFQMKRDPSKTLGYSTYRFKYLLTFSVEKDFSVLVKKLLDTLVEEKMGSDGIPLEVSEMVSSVQLLHRAVRKKCRKMVDMLINYSIVSHDSKPLTTYVFPTNFVGPGGLTPLHIAACTSGSEHIVDALTSDPLELGLSCWESQLDESGYSPYAYAASRNNHSYNQLIARKLGDKRNNQISISVDKNETIEQARNEQSRPALSHHNSKHKSASSCSKCAIIAARSDRRRRVSDSSHGMVARPFILSMLAIAAVCVCVCIYFRGHPYTGMDSPFTWEKLDYRTQ